jgi:hypothetical protein
MTITLDVESEKLVLRQIELGNAARPEEVVAKALASTALVEEWTDADRQWLEEHLAESDADIAAGRVYTGEEARRKLAERRANR